MKTLLDRNLRHKRHWHSGWNLKRRSIRFMCTAVDARINWQRPCHISGVLHRYYQHVE